MNIVPPSDRMYSTIALGMAFGLSSLTSLFKSDMPSVSGQTSVVGIDMGLSAIKIVQLKEERGVPTLETYGELQLGPYEGVDIGRGTRLQQQKMIEALIDIMREAGATAKNVTFALSYNSSFTATIAIPTVEEEKISPMVPIEARKYIPISLTKVNLEWFPIAVDFEKKVTETLISAVYNDARTRYESIIHGSGLTAVASEIEIFSSIRANLSPKDTVVAILDCGVSSTRLYIVNKGMVVKTHSVLLSGADLTTAISQSLAIEFKDAEELKRSVGMYGTEGDPRIQKTLTPLLDRGLRELHTVIKRFEEEEGVTVASVVLSGGGALLKGMNTYIQDMFSKPVTLAQPFSKVAYPAFLEDTLKEAGPSFSVAIGVALRAFQKE